MMLAAIPHDFAPIWINKDADWYSFLGNAASILGFAVSVFGFVLTFMVKRQVGRIEAEYVLRLQSGQWITQIDAYIAGLTASLNSFDLNKARIELTKANALIESIIRQTPQNLAGQGRKLNSEITASLRKGFWSRKIPLDVDEAYELYYRLIEFGENVKHYASQSQHRPTR